MAEHTNFKTVQWIVSSTNHSTSFFNTYNNILETKRIQIIKEWVIVH